MASRAPATSASASCAKTPVSGSTMPIFTGGSSRARIETGAAIALAVHARPALRTARRPIRRARGEAAFRAFGYKLLAPDQPGQTLVALAYVGKVRSPTPTSAVANPNARFACRLRSSAGSAQIADIPQRA